VQRQQRFRLRARERTASAGAAEDARAGDQVLRAPGQAAEVSVSAETGRTVCVGELATM